MEDWLNGRLTYGRLTYGRLTYRRLTNGRLTYGGLTYVKKKWYAPLLNKVETK